MGNRARSVAAIRSCTQRRLSRKATRRPTPSHSMATYYALLKAQGPNAAGGAYDYMVRDKMIGGFGLIAYPARLRQ